MKDIIAETIEQVQNTCSEALVLICAFHANEIPYGKNHSKIETSSETACGFFIEPDKIVTTIDALAGAYSVMAIKAELLNKIEMNHINQSFEELNDHQLSDVYVIEGITAFDARNNIVILKTTDTGTPLKLGNSDDVVFGDTVFSLGYGNDMKHKCKIATVQSRYNEYKWFQMKTEFKPRDGGGPVLNNNNEVVAVMAYGAASYVEDQNSIIATAIHSNVLKDLRNNVIDVVPLKQWQKYTRIRAYTLELQADEKAEMMDVSGAIKYYNNALKLNPDLVEIYNKRGVLKTRNRSFKAAIKDFDKMIQINPENLYAYNNRAASKSVLGDNEGALEDLNKAIEVNPMYIMGYANRGGLKKRLVASKLLEGDFETAQRYCNEAKQDFKKTLTLIPKNHRDRKTFQKEIQELMDLSIKIDQCKKEQLKW